MRVGVMAGLKADELAALKVDSLDNVKADSKVGALVDARVVSLVDKWAVVLAETKGEQMAVLTAVPRVAEKVVAKAGELAV